MEADGAAPEKRLHAQLRRETRDAHDRVDAAFSRFDLHDRDGYGRFLQAHAVALPALEEAVEAAGAAELVPDWAARRRSSALARDLRALHLPTPLSAPAPDLAEPGRALGALYVLEGSRLGGRLLLARVRAGPDPALRAATAYLSHKAGSWRSFLEILERHGGRPRQVVDGALAAFAVFERAAS